MTKLISYTMTALIATVAVSFAAPDKAAMEAKENAAWQAFKDKKTDEFKKMINADFRGVYDDGISTMQKEMDDMQKWDMKSFAISDYQVIAQGGAVVTTYTVKVEGTFNGKDASATYNAGSVWKKQKNGEWQAIFHTNVKQAAPTS